MLSYNYSSRAPTYGLVEQFKVEFSSNRYTSNYNSGGEGMIDIIGVTNVFFYNETMNNNGENSFGVATYFNTLNSSAFTLKM